MAVRMTLDAARMSVLPGQRRVTEGMTKNDLIRGIVESSIRRGIITTNRAANAKARGLRKECKDALIGFYTMSLYKEGKVTREELEN